MSSGKHIQQLLLLLVFYYLIEDVSFKSVDSGVWLEADLKVMGFSRINS